jgi:hypothetical protein
MSFIRSELTAQYLNSRIKKFLNPNFPKVFRFASFYIVALALSSILFLETGCKSTKETNTASSSQSDSTSAKPKNEIHTSGKVQTGTFVNGPAQDTSSTGTKPKQ